jgi:hypothetical protein
VGQTVALFSYTTMNLGDDIQTVAAYDLVSPLLGTAVDRIVYIDRDRSVQTAPEGPCLLVANGWYMNGPLVVPPPVTPLFIAVHLDPHWLSQHPEAFETFRRFEPVGCRDAFTLAQLRAHGVRAYLSYCLTLSLKRERYADTTAPRPVLWVDGPEAQWEAFQQQHPKALALKHNLDDTLRGLDPALVPRRHYLAREALWRYANATQVITRRLHCALPCKALGTDVVFRPQNPSDPRFTGYETLLGLSTPDSSSAQQPPLDVPLIRRLQERVITLSIQRGENVMQAVDTLDDPAAMVAQLEALFG